MNSNSEKLQFSHKFTNKYLDLIKNIKNTASLNNQKSNFIREIKLLKKEIAKIRDEKTIKKSNFLNYFSNLKVILNKFKEIAKDVQPPKIKQQIN